MDPTGTVAHLFELVDVAGTKGQAKFALPDARQLPLRRLFVKGNAPGTIAIAAPHDDCDEIDAAGGIITASGVGDAWPVAIFYSDGSQWYVESVA